MAKGYKLLNLFIFFIFYSRNVIFHEHIFPYSSSTDSLPVFHLLLLWLMLEWFSLPLFLFPLLSLLPLFLPFHLLPISPPHLLLHVLGEVLELLTLFLIYQTMFVFLSTLPIHTSIPRYLLLLCTCMKLGFNSRLFLTLLGKRLCYKNLRLLRQIILGRLCLFLLIRRLFHVSGFIRSNRDLMALLRNIKPF